MAQRLGIERLAYWARQLGFGAKTGIDLPGEVRGIVPDEQWKQDTFGQAIFPGEVLQAGIGQGYDTTTPLQILNAYAAVANGGKLYQPQVVREVVDADGNVVRPFAPKLIRKLKTTAANLQIMRLAARQVVTSRHTYNLADLPIVVAGKTGTAEFGVRDSKGGCRSTTGSSPSCPSTATWPSPTPSWRSSASPTTRTRSGTPRPRWSSTTSSCTST